MMVVPVAGAAEREIHPSARKAIFMDSSIFQGVEAGAFSALINEPQSVDFPRVCSTFEEGQPGERLYIVVEGMVKIGLRAADGRGNLLTIIGPPDMFGELSIFGSEEASCVQTSPQGAT